MRENWSTVSILVPLRRHHRHTQGCATVFPFLTPIMFPFPMPITTKGSVPLDSGGLVMDDILQRFVQNAPIAVMARAGLARVFATPALNELFERHAQAQYTRELTFSTLVRLMVQVAFGT